MKVYVLTQIGKNIASSPSNSGSDAMRILYYLRKSGYQASDEKLKDHLNLSGTQLRVATNELEHNQAIQIIGSA